MAWVLLVVTGALALAVGVLALRVRRLEQRLAVVVGEASSDAEVLPANADRSPLATLAQGQPDAEFVITHVGEADPKPEPVATVPAPVFADLVLKESLVQTASLVQGLRRALSPETRNRIRFHMRQEVKRSRKQRRTELREVRREWAARQRAAVPDVDAGAEGTAA